MLRLVSVLSLITLINCSPTYNSSAKQDKPRSYQRELPEKQFYVDTDGDGVFEVAELDEVPVPVQGKDQWTRDFYTSIRYPASARKNSIQGMVILEVLINELGQVKDIAVKQGLTEDCDREAKNALYNSTLQGYTPAKLGMQPVACKMSIPVGFWLN